LKPNNHVISVDTLKGMYVWCWCGLHLSIKIKKAILHFGCLLY